MKNTFELQGHRGARDLFPENTLEGFRATRALGITSIELDIAVTADNIAVVTHDVRLNADLTRTPEGDWLAGPGPLIRALTYAELRRYDVGRLRPHSPTALRHPRQQAVDGARIPTLAEVFAAIPDVLIDAELKTLPTQPDATVAPEEMAEIVMSVAIAASACTPQRLRIRSFDWRGLRHLQRTYPAVPLAFLTDTGVAPQTVAAAAAGPAIWAARHDGLTAASIKLARSLGLSVRPWTVNDPERAKQLVQWGAEGICTDAPDVLLAAGLAG